MTIQTLVRQYQWPLPRALQMATSNVADFLGFNNKGRIQLLRDADLLVFDTNMNLQYVFAKAKLLKTPSWTQTAWFPCV